MAAENLDSPEALVWKDSYENYALEFDSDMGGNLERILPRLEQHEIVRPGSSLFSIGGGFGALEGRLANDYRVKVSLLDPGRKLVKAFQNRMTRLGLPHLLQDTWVERFQDFSYPKKFDSVISVHSWYYIGKSRESLDKALSLCKPKGGSLYIALTARKGNFCDLQTLISKADQRPAFFFDDFADWAKSEGFDFETNTWPVDRDINYFFSNGEFTPHGRDWISLIHRTPWEEISDELKAHVKDFFLSVPKLEEYWSEAIFRV